MSFPDRTSIGFQLGDGTWLGSAGWPAIPREGDTVTVGVARKDERSYLVTHVMWRALPFAPEDQPLDPYELDHVLVTLRPLEV